MPKKVCLQGHCLASRALNLHLSFAASADNKEQVPHTTAGYRVPEENIRKNEIRNMLPSALIIPRGTTYPFFARSLVFAFRVIDDRAAEFIPRVSKMLRPLAKKKFPNEGEKKPPPPPRESISFSSRTNLRVYWNETAGSLEMGVRQLLGLRREKNSLLECLAMGRQASRCGAKLSAFFSIDLCTREMTRVPQQRSRYWLLTNWPRVYEESGDKPSHRGIYSITNMTHHRLTRSHLLSIQPTLIVLFLWKNSRIESSLYSPRRKIIIFEKKGTLGSSNSLKYRVCVWERDLYRGVCCMALIWPR